jgi:1-aminocyclopropane-1-carboxylate deaminase
LIESVFERNGVNVDVLRLDKLNTLAPGNKWFNLNLNLTEARRLGAETLLSFGGAFSNHLHALAAVAQYEDLAAVACVRADPDRELSPSLQDAKAWGMHLHFLSRSEYRRRHDPGFVSEILAQYPRPYLIPEGGSNLLGAQGCCDIAELIPACGREYDAVLLACGTGTTLAGVSARLADGLRLIGIPVLKAEAYMAADIQQMQLGLAHYRQNWALDYRFHCGGYARLPEFLRKFMVDFEQAYDLELDPVYTAKMMYGLCCMIDDGEFGKGARVLAIHTGGLQGRRGYPELTRD